MIQRRHLLKQRPPYFDHKEFSNDTINAYKLMIKVFWGKVVFWELSNKNGGRVVQHFKGLRGPLILMEQLLSYLGSYLQVGHFRTLFNLRKPFKRVKILNFSVHEGGIIFLTT